MLELPKGVWRWLAENGRDLARIAVALETIAAEITEIRKAMQDDHKEENR